MTARLRMDQQAASSGMFQREIRPNPWIGWLVSARSSKNRSASYVGVPKNIDHSSSHQKVLYEYYSSTRRVLSYDSTSTGSFMFHILEGNFLAVLIFAPNNGGLITTTHQTVPTARNRNECVSVRRKSQLRGGTYGENAVPQAEFSWCDWRFFRRKRRQSAKKVSHSLVTFSEVKRLL